MLQTVWRPQCTSHGAALVDQRILVCPGCKSSLRNSADGIRCDSCGRVFGLTDGAAELLCDPGSRFADEYDAARNQQEARGQRHQVTHCWLPLLQQLAGDRDAALRVLSVGCGVGADVELLCEEGHDAYGLDCGARVHAWASRAHADHLVCADARQIPFPDGFFDFVYAECILPHVGTMGDSVYVSPGYQQQRSRVAGEMARVTREGGWVAHATPNRLFPLDFWHFGDHPVARTFRLHSPRDRMLLSYADHVQLFVGAAGCREPRLIAAQGHWGFYRKRSSLLSSLLVAPMRAYLALVSSAGWLLRSPLNPFLIVVVQK